MNDLPNYAAQCLAAHVQRPSCRKTASYLPAKSEQMLEVAQSNGVTYSEALVGIDRTAAVPQGASRYTICLFSASIQSTKWLRT